ncbi:hypothetical protein GCM10023082_51960 [Streptomyces tremellae]|uniref:Uncharacterized protein n=1 Tax=Streptomyces tremellae TaxID=1124239 RepID=A0ABP7FWR1_9ACTN
MEDRGREHHPVRGCDAGAQLPGALVRIDPASAVGLGVEHGEREIPQVKQVNFAVVHPQSVSHRRREPT